MAAICDYKWLLCIWISKLAPFEQWKYSSNRNIPAMEEQTYKMACYHWWKKHKQTPSWTPPLAAITIAVIISIQLNEPSRDNINQKRRWNSDDRHLTGDTKMYRDFARFHFNHTHAHTQKHHTNLNAQATEREKLKKVTKKQKQRQKWIKREREREKSRKQIELNLKMSNSKAHNARNGDNTHTHTTFGIRVKHFHIHSWNAIDVQAHFI